MLFTSKKSIGADVAHVSVTQTRAHLHIIVTRQHLRLTRGLDTKRIVDVSEEGGPGDTLPDVLARRAPGSEGVEDADITRRTEALLLGVTRTELVTLRRGTVLRE